MARRALTAKLLASHKLPRQKKTKVIAINELIWLGEKQQANNLI